jgi:hypothetical protein
VVHLDPSHEAADAFEAATHALSEAQETWLGEKNVETGLVPCLHAVPFHCSVSSLDPSAMQKASALQDTLSSASAPSGAETAVLLQLVPFQRAALGTSLNDSLNSVPTAVQDVSDVHDTSSTPTALTWLLHSVPFQRSRWPSPAAVHPLSDVHETEVSAHPLGVGSVWSVHLVPSHVSAVASASPGDSLLEKPTATQNLSDAHDTDESLAVIDPAGTAGAWSLHDVPSQVSVMATCGGVLAR